MWNQDNRWAEIGYALSKKYWSRGIITEAVKVMIKFGFENLDLNRIEAMCKLQNTASEKVLLKIGMKFEGILRQRIFSCSAYHDVKMYSLLKEKYPNLEWVSETE